MILQFPQELQRGCGVCILQLVFDRLRVTRFLALAKPRHDSLEHVWPIRMLQSDLLKILDAVGSTICANEGSVWITEENSRKDVVLTPGACFRIDRPGLTIVQAFAGASVSLA